VGLAHVACERLVASAGCCHTWLVPSEMLDRLRNASHAYRKGDVEPFVSLLDEGMEWRGVTRGHLWWRRTPS
jgi:hypothetical protein